MIVEVLTKQDLEAFKAEIVAILQSFTERQQQGTVKQFLRTREVKKLLGISTGTLANLRVKGLLHPTKVEGVYYYASDEIRKLLTEGGQK